MSCSGLHCPGCGNGGGGKIAALVVLVIIGAVIHAIWHTLVEVAEITAITVLGAAGLAAIAGIAWLVHRTRHDRPRRPIEARPIIQLPPAARPQLESSHKPPIGPPRELHLHIHGVSADQLAAIVTQRGTYLEEDL